jgi:hypothetical protein
VLLVHPAPRTIAPISPTRSGCSGIWAAGRHGGARRQLSRRHHGSSAPHRGRAHRRPGASRWCSLGRAPLRRAGLAIGIGAALPTRPGATCACRPSACSLSA